MKPIEISLGIYYSYILILDNYIFHHDPLIYIITLEGHFETTVLLNMRALNLTGSRNTATFIRCEIFFLVIERLLGRKSSGSGLKIREYGHIGPSR
jgi:hypothetical protein